MNPWKFVAAGFVPQKWPLFVVGLCCLFFMSAGPVRAQTAVTVESLQAQIDALQQQVSALKAAQAEQAQATQAAQAQAAKAAQAAAAQHPRRLPRRAPE